MRIISGTNRGQTIESPKGLQTRPTLDRVKEAMFGMIQFSVPGAVVLDLFAGSGNLGLEALSRGAKYAVFNDVSPQCVAVIKQNAAKLKLESACAVYQNEAAAAIRAAVAAGLRFDIVFLDPPYEAELMDCTIDALCAQGALSESAIIVAEHAVGNPPKVSREELRVSPPRKYGDVALTIIRKEAAV